MKISLLRMALIGLSVFTQGCYDSEGYSKYTKLQYVPDMADAPRAKAQLTYLDPPEHSVSRGTWIYRSTHDLSEKYEKNPFAPTPRIVAEGKELYEKMCVACHTASGKGQHKLKGFPNPPDITNSAYLDREDGYFFHLITFGSPSGIMPSLGHSTDINERWKIIHYLRTMQRKGE